jgi:hypothetical protein
MPTSQISFAVAICLSVICLIGCAPQRPVPANASIELRLDQISESRWDLSIALVPRSDMEIEHFAEPQACFVLSGWTDDLSVRKISSGGISGTIHSESYGPGHLLVGKQSCRARFSGDEAVLECGAFGELRIRKGEPLNLRCSFKQPTPSVVYSETLRSNILRLEYDGRTLAVGG